jgi:peroxiredoxin
MRNLITLGLVAAFYACPVNAQIYVFGLKKGELDNSNKGMPILEGWVDYESSSREKIVNVPQNLSDVKYTSIPISQAQDSILAGLKGIDKTGSTLYYFDQNNDEDFSNDEPLVFKREGAINVARVPITYEDNVSGKTIHKQTGLSLYERETGKIEYHLNELWEATISIGNESINVALQRFPPIHPILFIDVNYSGKYEKPFYVNREILALGGRFFRVKVDFSNEKIILEETKQKPVDEGYPAPDFEANIWKANKTFRLSEQKGKFTVMTFWSPLCPGSKAEAPLYRKLANEFKADPAITFLAIISDSTALKNFLKEHQHSFWHIVNAGLWDQFGVTAPFVTLIIDKNGIIKKRYFKFTSEISNELQKMTQNR